jgi:plasmid stabilization system protein ParE
MDQNEFPVFLSAGARHDFFNAFYWYEMQVEGLGVSFRKYFEDALEYLSKKPFSVQIRYDRIRVYFLKKFPYGIHFFVDEQTVEILAVFHTSQDPYKWHERNA